MPRGNYFCATIQRGDICQFGLTSGDEMEILYHECQVPIGPQEIGGERNLVKEAAPSILCVAGILDDFVVLNIFVFWM